jgi:hypothetical protein
MSTSNRIMLAEVGIVALLTTLGVAAAAPGGDVWSPSFAVHAAWLPIIVLAGRYGLGGLLASLVVTACMLAIASMAAGHGLGAVTTRARLDADLPALATAVLVAWIAMARERRLSRAYDDLQGTTAARLESEATVDALHDSLSYLRRRQDRLDCSLSVWRDLATRLERGDDDEAARAALELCQVRLGADAGVVYACQGETLVPLASHGALPAGPAVRRVTSDRTIRDALVARSAVPAADGSDGGDSDVAVAILDQDSRLVVGAIALRGLSAGVARAADLVELRLIAQWLAPALHRRPRTTTTRPLADHRRTA